MQWTDFDSSTCSIARSLDVLGDRWTLLVLRDLANGVRRFADLQEHLGVARDVLSRRLAALVEAGVVARRAYQEPGERTRSEYLLTAAGRELQPVLIALMDWGDRHLAGAEGPPMRVEHVDCGAVVHARLTCAEGHHVGGRDVRLVPQPAAHLREGSVR